jgi:hypothetical protein
MDHSQNGPVEPGTTVFERDFLDLLRALYRRRWLVVGGVLAVAALSLLASVFSAKTYRSTGFFQLSDPYQSRISSVFSVASRFLESSQFLVLSQLKEAELLPVLEVLKDKELPFGEVPNPYILTIQDFKKFSSAYRSGYGFLTFARHNGELAEGELEMLRAAAGGGRLSKWVSGVYALSRDEMKDIWRSLENQQNFVSGVNVRFEAGAPELAQKGLGLLGRYIAFATLQERVRDYIAANLSEFTLLSGRYGNDILRYGQLIRQLDGQKADLLKLKKKYPGRAAGRQLVSLEGNSRRYLSVEAQIIGLESRIIDLQAMVATFAAEKKKAELYLGYFTQCKGLQLNGAKNGSALLEMLDTFTRDFFSANETAEGALEVRNSLSTDLKRFSILQQQSLRFVSGPTSPTAPSGPRKSVYLLFGLFLGGLVFVALAIFLEFWRRHKEYITE